MSSATPMMKLEQAIEYMDLMQVTDYLQKILDFLKRDCYELHFPNISSYVEAFLVNLVTDTTNLKRGSLTHENQKITSEIIRIIEINKDVYTLTHTFENGKLSKNLLVYKKIYLNSDKNAKPWLEVVMDSICEARIQAKMKKRTRNRKKRKAKQAAKLEQITSEKPATERQAVKKQSTPKIDKKSDNPSNSQSKSKAIEKVTQPSPSIINPKASRKSQYERKRKGKNRETAPDDNRQHKYERFGDIVVVDFKLKIEADNKNATNDTLNEEHQPWKKNERYNDIQLVNCQKHKASTHKDTANTDTSNKDNIHKYEHNNGIKLDKSKSNQKKVCNDNDTSNKHKPSNHKDPTANVFNKENVHKYKHIDKIKLDKSKLNQTKACNDTSDKEYTHKHINNTQNSQKYDQIDKIKLDKSKPNQTKISNATSDKENTHIDNIQPLKSKPKQNIVTEPPLTNLHVAVMTEPFTEMTREQVLVIKRSLESAILDLCSQDSSVYWPSFLGQPNHTEGVLKLQCEGEKDVEWLKNSVETIVSPVPNSMLVVKPQKDIPKEVKSAIV